MVLAPLLPPPEAKAAPGDVDKIDTLHAAAFLGSSLGVNEVSWDSCSRTSAQELKSSSDGDTPVPLGSCRWLLSRSPSYLRVKVHRDPELLGCVPLPQSTEVQGMRISKSPGGGTEVGKGLPQTLALRVRNATKRPGEQSWGSRDP